MKKRLLIIGGSGLLGTNWALAVRNSFNVHLALHHRLIEITGVHSHQLDWQDIREVERYCAKLDPHIIVNACGFTDVDGCESNPRRSYDANVHVAKLFAQIATECDAKYVHISTDHIFDGSVKLVEETQSPCPLNTYAQHKYMAEQEILEICSSALICRTNFIGWGTSYRRSFSDEILDKLKSGSPISMFDDVFFSPVSTSQLVHVATILIEKSCAGIVNICSNERISKYEFSKKLATVFAFDPEQIQPVQAFRLRNQTKRPFDLSLSDTKLRKILNFSGITIDSTLEALKADREKFWEIRNLGKTIPYGKHFIDQSDIKAVTKTLSKGALTQGPEIQHFEQALADYTGAKYAVAVSSATAGLHLSYLALGLEPRKSVLTSPITFVSTANAAHFCGGHARFADININTINMGFDATFDALKQYSDIHIVTPVVFGGASDGIPKIAELAKSKGKYVVEDAAHGLGGNYACGAKIGSCRYSDCTVFSLHPVKSIAAGEGGVITTNDIAIYRTLLRLRSHGINKGDDSFLLPENAMTGDQINLWYYEMRNLGFHYRLTDIQASLASSQLLKLDKFMERRRELAKRYRKHFEKNLNLKSAQSIDLDRSANHLFPVLIDFDTLGFSRNDLMKLLRKDGIFTQVHYIPVMMHPYYANMGHTCDLFPNSIDYYKGALSIPLYYELSNFDQGNFLKIFEKNISRLSRNGNFD